MPYGATKEELAITSLKKTSWKMQPTINEYTEKEREESLAGVGRGPVLHQEINGKRQLDMLMLASARSSLKS